MKKKILIFLLITLIALPLFASNNEEYEYMVVSFGTAQFSDLRSKTMAYWEDGISKEALSASSYEKNLDILGKHGWEVISITGAIGGDQQVILKRDLSIKRSETELKTIDENSKKVLQGLLDKIIAEDNKKKEVEQSSLEAEKPSLFELDSYENKIKIQKQKTEFENSFKDCLNTFSKTPLDVSFEWSYSFERDLEITIYYDVTKECLINTNQYRLSKVKEILNPILDNLETIYKDETKISDIHVEGRIKYKEELFDVGYVYNTRYSGNRWLY